MNLIRVMPAEGVVRAVALSVDAFQLPFSRPGKRPEANKSHDPAHRIPPFLRPLPSPDEKEEAAANKFLRAVTKPFPKSRKVHVEGAGEQVSASPCAKSTRLPTRDFQGQVDEQRCRSAFTTPPDLTPIRRSSIDIRQRAGAGAPRPGSRRAPTPKATPDAKCSRATTATSPPVTPSTPASRETKGAAPAVSRV